MNDNRNPEWPNHEKIYDECMSRAKKSNWKTQWLHLADAVEKGNVSPMEAYDCFKAGYVLEILTVRESRYMHLLH